MSKHEEFTDRTFSVVCVAIGAGMLVASLTPSLEGTGVLTFGALLLLADVVRRRRRT